MEGLYWKIRYAYEAWYFKRKYATKVPKIYYDKKFRVYVNPKVLEEKDSCLEYVCSETVRYSLIYIYSIKGKDTHAHTITEVFKDAYNYAETFKILDEDQYSKQELELINKLIKQGIEDRKINSWSRKKSFIQKNRTGVTSEFFVVFVEHLANWARHRNVHVKGLNLGGILWV